jgi:predicted Zn finger-like uncharacterized protein
VIVACPACATRYQVDEAALANPAGRSVRCANCGHTWRYARDQAVPAELRIAAAPRGEARAAEHVEPGPAARRSGGAAVVVAALILIVAAAGLGLLADRDTVIALWPPAAGLYAAAGLAGEPLGAGLEIRKVVPSRTAAGLLVDGEIANTVKRACAVPRLRVALRDAGGKELAAKLVDPPKRRLMPGEVEHFETPFAHPSAAATGVVVTFAAG